MCLSDALVATLVKNNKKIWNYLNTPETAIIMKKPGIKIPLRPPL
jgi:hypothetical protein